MGGPQRVTFLVNSLCPPNGVVSASVALARQWRDEGAFVTFICHGDASKELREEFRPILLRPWARFTTEVADYAHSKTLLKGPRRFLTPLIAMAHRRRSRRALDSLSRSTLVVAAGMECLEYLGPGVRSRAGLVAVQVHTSYDGLSDDQRARLVRCCELADLVTCLTEADAIRTRDVARIDVVAIPNACAVERHRQENPQRRVVYLGRLSPEKQVDHALRAFARAAARDWRFDVYGNGPCEDELRGLAAALDADIRIRGVVDRPEDAFEGASIHVQTSLFEGFGMAIAEASRCGVPTVAYLCSPGVELTLGRNGVGVPAQDEFALSDALRDMMTDDDLRVRLGEAVCQDERFDASVVAGLWRTAWNNRARCRVSR